MKRFLMILMALCLVLSLFGCSQTAGTQATQPPEATEAPVDDWTYIQEKGILVIGITVYEPMNYYDENNNLVGFDTEYAEEVCQKLGLLAEFVEINWDTKEIELQSKNIDCIWNGLTVTEERRENMDFTDSYIKNMQVCVIRTSDASKYTDSASMKAANIVAEISSAGESAVAADENLSAATYTAVAKQADALLEVKSGTADVAVIDYVMAKSMVGEGTDYSDLMIVPNLELAVEEYAIGLRLGSTAVAKINEATAALLEDGTLQALAEEYDLTNSLLANMN